MQRVPGYPWTAAVLCTSWSTAMATLRHDQFPTQSALMFPVILKWAARWKHLVDLAPRLFTQLITAVGWDYVFCAIVHSCHTHHSPHCTVSVLDYSTPCVRSGSLSESGCTCCIILLEITVWLNNYSLTNSSACQVLLLNRWYKTVMLQNSGCPRLKLTCQAACIVIITEQSWLECL